MSNNLFKDKRVCIIGPASYIQNIVQRKFVDSHDIIVRLLLSLPVPKRLIPNTGNRTDIIASSLVCDRGINHNRNDLKLILNNGNILLCPINGPAYKGVGYGPLIESEIKRQTSEIASRQPSTKVIHVDPKWFAEYKKELDTNPSTGMATICQLISYPIRELYVTGFTLDVTACPYNPEYLNRTFAKKNIGNGGGWHNGKKEVAFFRKLVARDPRIKFDNHIKEHVL